MVSDTRGSYPEPSSAIRAIAPKIGCSRASQRRYVAHAETDGGVRSGAISQERARIRELERDVRKLRQANQILSEEDQELIRRDQFPGEWRRRI